MIDILKIVLEKIDSDKIEKAFKKISNYLKMLMEVPMQVFQNHRILNAPVDPNPPSILSVDSTTKSGFSVEMLRISSEK